MLIDDLPEIVALRTRSAADDTGKRRASVAVSQLYPHLFFDTESGESTTRSLVSTDRSGQINGMIGVAVRQIRIHESLRTAAIGADLFVAEDARSTLAGVALLKEFLAGPQDVTICDVASGSTRHIWNRLGGFVASAYNLNWIAVLRPAKLAAELLRERPFGGITSRIALGSAPVIDRCLASVISCRVDPVPAGLISEVLTPEEFYELHDGLVCESTVRPVYSAARAEWIWKRLAYVSPEGGAVSAICVRNSHGKLLGWYIYTLEQGGTARVIQIAARPEAVDVVVNHLFATASNDGASAVAGRIQPDIQQAFIDRGCLIRARNTYTLVHSRDPHLASAYRSGQAWLTPLDGEAILNAWHSPEAAVAEFVETSVHHALRV